MRLVTSPGYHADFYSNALQSIAGSGGAPRVLVSGAADYSMLAYVLAAFRERRLEPDVTVIDLCETPLWLCRWYAERSSCRIQTHRSDVQDYAAEGTFDALCTDNFFGRFSPAQRIGLLAKWRELLRPGGKAITVIRLRPGSAEERVGFTADQARAFGTAVLRGAEAMRDSLEVDPDKLGRMAEEYARRHFTYSTGSQDEVRELFERSGFRVDELSGGSVTADNRKSASGPSVRTNAEYASVVASRI